MRVLYSLILLISNIRPERMINQLNLAITLDGHPRHQLKAIKPAIFPKQIFYSSPSTNLHPQSFAIVIQ